ncbi:MAG TPA: small ribosomal subunit Rsm22 family protein [Myxococcales bacterium]|nr:small ribosomal subunit Rsm22 family protein [Myxococcales bacterium]
MSLSQRVPLLLRRARALLGIGPGPDDRLARAELRRCARAVEDLHEGLVGRRELARASTYGQPAHLAAYLLWWWPQTYAKVRAALALARSAGALQGLPGQPRILDVAAGPGAAGLALLDALGGTALALDQSAAALSEGRALSGGALRTQEADLRRGLPALESDFDLAVVANALSELPAPVRVPLIGALPVADGGAVLLIEPALRETGRALLEVRDELLLGGAWKAAAPCLTQRPCPALQHPRDWCTAQHAWDPPPHVGQLAAELGLRADQELAYAPLVLTRRVAQPPPDVWRVVGVPQPEKGKKRLFVCSDQGRMPVARLSRDATAQNADFDRLGRGDLALLRGAAPKGDGLRIGPAGEVRRIDRLDAETPAASGVSEPG